MSRGERVQLHRKQERLQIKDGIPSASELREGVPVMRGTKNGLFEYVKHKGIIYQKQLETFVRQKF